MASRVYDCVLFNGEFDALAIRIRELDDLVHRFVVVESDTTFSGLKKTVRFTKEHPAVRTFAARLDFVLVDDMPTTDNAWDREVWQRNAVMRGLTSASDNDLILMSDVDEIPRAECVREALADEKSSAFGFRMNLYYFYMNYKNLNGNSDVVWTIGAKFALLKTNSPDALRYGVRNQAIAARIFESGGWHFSYLMDEATIIAKIKSFSHQEYNRGRFLRKINIEQLVSASDDLFGRSGFRWSIVEEADLPRYVIEHKTDFQRFFVTAQPKRSKALRTSPAQRLLPRQLGQSLRTYMAAVVKGFRA
jgi:hypothetical protein